MTYKQILSAGWVGLFSMIGAASAAAFDGPFISPSGLQGQGDTYEVMAEMPTACFEIVSIEEKLPKGVGGIPKGAVPVTMTVANTADKDGAMCAQVVTPVQGSIELKALSIPPRIAAGFVVFDGKIVSYRLSWVDAAHAVPMKKAGDAEASGPVLKTSNWRAWINMMPMAGPTLHVRGSALLSSKSYTARLVFADPQGIVGSTLLLDLVPIARGGSWQEIPYRKDVAFSMGPPFPSGYPPYNKVEIRLDGEIVGTIDTIPTAY